MKPEYVCGFAFCESSCGNNPSVVLIEKKKPAWQAGKLNGVGGLIEPGETPHEAMVREFREEAGVMMPDWTRFIVLAYPEATIHFFCRFTTSFRNIRSVTEEKVGIYDTLFLPNNCLPNLRWLIPMALSGEIFEEPLVGK